MQVIDKQELFTEITDEESAIIKGGDSIQFGVSEAQIIFALGAYTYTLLLTGNKELANSVLITQWNRAFTSNVEKSFAQTTTRRHFRSLPI
ncbi:hypothetical protein G7B40_019090 [Aetokthonos hydrillicola Thurmond2011]|jgi:hypothetical protein|uniref:Uncharacterized protein n=2 Tax=Aetokthonos TaxID=1550243 RepID=A0AAP5IBG7_9CYAN|nr:hypothetical protein [Aetokthonos hydrillicola Thurmond2011]